MKIPFSKIRCILVVTIDPELMILVSMIGLLVSITFEFVDSIVYLSQK